MKVYEMLTSKLGIGPYLDAHFDDIFLRLAGLNDSYPQVTEESKRCFDVVSSSITMVGSPLDGFRDTNEHLKGQLEGYGDRIPKIVNAAIIYSLVDMAKARVGDYHGISGCLDHLLVTEEERAFLERDLGATAS